jgi:hypothetical protein
MLFEGGGVTAIWIAVCWRVGGRVAAGCGGVEGLLTERLFAEEVLVELTIPVGLGNAAADSVVVEADVEDELLIGNVGRGADCVSGGLGRERVEEFGAAIVWAVVVGGVACSLGRLANPVDVVLLVAADGGVVAAAIAGRVEGSGGLMGTEDANEPEGAEADTVAVLLPDRSTRPAVRWLISWLPAAGIVWFAELALTS